MTTIGSLHAIHAQGSNRVYSQLLNTARIASGHESLTGKENWNGSDASQIQPQIESTSLPLLNKPRRQGSF
jgi:hypothetical protein